MPPQITGLRGASAGKSFPLGDTPLTFGRNPDNMVVIAGGRASRRHAEIRREGADYVLTDLGSANGTLLNGQRLTAPHRLRPGDTFEIGEESFRFDAPSTVDATIIAAPAPIATPPTEPVQAQPPLPQPARPQPQGGYVGALPSTPSPQAGAAAPQPAAPRKRSCFSPLFIVLGLVGLVLVVGCIGGAVALSRAGVLSFIPGSTPTPRATPRPTEEGEEPGATDEPAAPAPTREPVAGGADWTILVYLDGDNNLEADAVGDLNEMEMIGSSDQIKIVVQLDRIRQEGPQDDDSNGDWDTTKRFLVQQNDDPTEIGSEELDDLGELNMGDPQTLSDFITWGVKEYPAQRYALILWDHGSSWAGIAFDDTDGKKGITMPELEAALRTAQEQSGVGKFDLIGFDACLMAQMDVLQTIAPFSNVGVASVELEPNEGWAWDLWLRQLADDPSQDAAAAARSVVDTYAEFYKDSGDDTVTMSAFDLTQIDEVRERLNAFSDAMIAGLDGSYQAIAEARTFVDAYSQPKPEEFSAVDLGHFTQLVNERGAADEVSGPSQALFEAIEQARIAEFHGSFHANSTGLSVFFPQVAELYPDFYEQASPLPQVTSWAEFLKAFHGAGDTQVSVPQITDLQLSDTTIGVNNPGTLSGTVSGKDIAQVFFFVGIPNSDRTGVELTDIDFIYPPGTSPNTEVPSWDDGDNDVSQTWDGSRWALSNGSETIPVLLGPIKYGTNRYGVEGVYTVSESGEQIAAGLEFEVRQGRATLEHIWGFPKGQKQEAQPFELEPAAGDTFTAFLRTYTVQGDTLAPDFVEGETITLSGDPLSAVQVPANSGEYVAGFLVRDIAGRFSYQYADITVDNSGAGPVNPPGQPAPDPAPGSQTGTLAFSSAEMRFALEYPDAWQTLDTGNNKVFFYDPAETSGTFVSVDVYALEQQPADANQALLDAYAEALGKEQDFKQAEVEPFQLAGEEGLSFQYSYTDENGNAHIGTAIVITSAESGLSYLVTAQALADDYDGQVDTFNVVLDSMTLR